LEAFNIRHSGLDPESRMYFWIPAFAGMTAQFRRIFMQRLGYVEYMTDNESIKNILRDSRHFLAY
jgi:hypothetical protein